MRRRDIILISGLLSLACISVFAVALLILQAQPAPADSTNVPSGSSATPGPQPTYTVTYVEVTGLNQYRLAEAAAREWAPDAQVAAASASWTQVTTIGQVGEPTLWTYRFYSPARQRTLIVTVEPDGQLESIEHPVKVTLPPRPIPASEWVLDSSAALATWLDYGGAQMLRTNPGLELLIQLRMSGTNPNPVWVVVGVDDRTEDIRVVAIDANEGVVTTTSSEN